MLNVIKEITEQSVENIKLHMRNNIQKKQEHTHVKNIKRRLMTSN